MLGVARSWTVSLAAGLALEAAEPASQAAGSQPAKSRPALAQPPHATAILVYRDHDG